MLDEQGPGGLTAEKVAEAAGVSRRTLYNYFPSVEAALNAPLEAFLDQASDRLASLPADLPATTATVEVLQALAGEREALTTVAEVFVLAEGSPQLSRLQLEAWDHCAARVYDEMSRRVPAEAEFELAIYVHAVVGAGRAAFRSWADHHADDYRGTAAIDDLQRRLTVAMEQLRDGFPALRDIPTVTPDTEES